MVKDPPQPQISPLSFDADIPIALPKVTRFHTKHPIGNFYITNHLSSNFANFTIALSVAIPKFVVVAFHNPA